MGRPLNKSDCSDFENFNRNRNAVCSKNLLEALKSNHGHEFPECPTWDSPPTLPPIPNKVIAEAVKIAFPAYLSRVEAIQRATLSEFPKLTVFDLKSQRRTAIIVRARQIAMYLAKRMTGQSFPEIGRRFGGRDHSTIIHAVQKIDYLLGRDPELVAQVERIKELVPEAT